MLLSICSEEVSTENTYVSHSKPMAELAIANLPLPLCALVFPDTHHYWVGGIPVWCGASGGGRGAQPTDSMWVR